MQIPLSAVMITHQSDRRLKEVLQSLEWCAEVVIIDSNSTDQTLKIIAEANSPSRPVRVFQRAFDTFSNQKQFSVDQAANDWVFVIDSDEVVTPELKTEIISKLGVGDAASKAILLNTVAYEVPRVLYFLNQKVSHGGGIDAPLRIFNRTKGRFNGAPVHEKILVTGKTERLNGFLNHFSYDDLTEYFKKFKRYTTLAAVELEKSGRSASMSKILFSFPAQFVKLYIFKAGFLDGISGFLWCFFSACSPVVKYWKLLKLNAAKAAN